MIVFGGIITILLVVLVYGAIVKSDYLKLKSNTESCLGNCEAIYEFCNPTASPLVFGSDTLDFKWRQTVDDTLSETSNVMSDAEYYINISEERTYDWTDTTQYSCDVVVGTGANESTVKSTCYNHTPTNYVVSKESWTPWDFKVTLQPNECKKIKLNINKQFNKPLDHVFTAWIDGQYVEFTEFAWFNASYGKKRTLTITNNDAQHVLPANFSVNISFDHASLVTAGDSQADGDDIRISINDSVEISRVVLNSWNLAGTVISFKLIDGVIAAGGSDANYQIYYDSATAQPPVIIGEDVHDKISNVLSYANDNCIIALSFDNGASPSFDLCSEGGMSNATVPGYRALDGQGIGGYFANISGGTQHNFTQGARMVLTGADAATFASVPEQNILGNWSIGVWALSTDNSTAQDRYLIRNSNGNNLIHLAFANGEGLQCMFADNAATNVKATLATGSANYTNAHEHLGQWHHWGCNWDATKKQLIFYLDGKAMAHNNNSAITELGNIAGTWTIGRAASGKSWLGDIDEMFLINRSLSPSEWLGIYNGRWNVNRVSPTGALGIENSLSNTVFSHYNDSTPGTDDDVRAYFNFSSDGGNSGNISFILYLNGVAHSNRTNILPGPINLTDFNVSSSLFNKSDTVVIEAKVIMNDSTNTTLVNSTVITVADTLPNITLVGLTEFTNGTRVNGNTTFNISVVDPDRGDNFTVTLLLNGVENYTAGVNQTNVSTQFHTPVTGNLVNWSFNVSATGNHTLSNNGVVIVDFVPPTITEASNSSITSSTVNIFISSGEPFNYTLFYDSDNTSLDQKKSNSSFAYNHTVQITGLTASTAYYWQVSLFDNVSFGSMNINTTEAFDFTTSAAAVPDSPGGGGGGGSDTTIIIGDLILTPKSVSTLVFGSRFSRVISSNRVINSCSSDVFGCSIYEDGLSVEIFKTFEGQSVFSQAYSDDVVLKSGSDVAKVNVKITKWKLDFFDGLVVNTGVLAVPSFPGIDLLFKRDGGVVNGIKVLNVLFLFVVIFGFWRLFLKK